MRTSRSQFELMVEYMKTHGDLSKPGDGPRGRVANIERWTQLAECLNMDTSGSFRSFEKWKKTQDLTTKICPHFMWKKKAWVEWDTCFNAEKDVNTPPAQATPSATRAAEHGPTANRLDSPTHALTSSTEE